MRSLPWLLFIALASSSCAEKSECVAEKATYEGKAVVFDVCTATVDETVKANFDGHRFVAYIVRFKGQRIVVTDISSQSNFAPGDRVSFTVLTMPPSWEPDATERKYVSFYLSGPAASLKGQP
jgi:hypothetical protein